MPLSPDTTALVDKLFAPPRRAEARVLLEERCGINLPCLADLDARQLERYRFAALKLSAGDLEQLGRAVALSQLDWRDLLVNAGFADDLLAHRAWCAQVLGGGGGSR